jgi:uncharacterized protein (UPF0262 family)
LISTIRIDHALWAAANAVRRHDWRISITGLVEEARLGSDDEAVLHLSHDETAVVLATFDAGGGPQNLYELPIAELRRHVDEYLTIIAKMQEGDAGDLSAHMHALDMAKKVVHDAGARTLAGRLPTFAREHESYRRLFSLVLSVVVDVTTLPGATAHRRHV